MTPLAGRIAQLLHPLDEFYKDSVEQLPEVKELEAAALPSPFCDLLAHDRDMTSTLEAHIRERLVLRPMALHRSKGRMHRQVVLAAESDDRPIEFGAIQIALKGLPAEAQEKVNAARIPLGAILRDCSVSYRCAPTAYFSIPVFGTLGQVLRLDAAEKILYGRHARLYHDSGDLLADVVEILPARFEPLAQR